MADRLRATLDDTKDGAVTTNAQTRKCHVRARVKEFGYPPIHDALVIGREAPIGREAFTRALKVLVAAPFTQIEVGDEIVADMLVRSSLLLRIPEKKLVAFVLRHVKPLMTGTEILHLDLDAEIEVEEDSV